MDIKSTTKTDISMNQSELNIIIDAVRNLSQLHDISGEYKKMVDDVRIQLQERVLR